MKNIFSFLVLLFLSVPCVLDAQTVLVSNSLKFDESVALTGDAKPAELEGWDFVNCSLTENSPHYVQVNSGGSVTTPQLGDITGNANVSFYIKRLDNSSELELSVVGGSGTIEPEPETYKVNTWIRVNPYLLRNASSTTRISFSGSKFLIAKVEVKDIGDGVFYESFNRCDGTGGRDGDFISNGEACSSNSFDNPNGATDKAMEGKQCIYLAENGYYETSGIPTSETGSYVLTFDVAGRNESRNLAIIYYDANGEEVKKTVPGITKGKWKSYKLLIPEKNVTGITFSANSSYVGSNGGLVYLDEVKVSEVKNASMNEADANADLPASQLGKTVYMQLTRTFKKDIWNTCCLPFDVTANLLKIAADDEELVVELKKLKGITAEGIYSFESAETIPAGEPFLLKVDKEIVNPLFKNVVIKALAPQSKSDVAAPGYSFNGCFGMISLNTDGTNVFIGIDGYLHTPSPTGNVMKGMRAYMVLPEKDATRGIYFEEVVTGSGSPIYASRQVHKGDCSYYNLNGQRVQPSGKGLYILRSSDGLTQGKAKKVIVK